MTQRIDPAEMTQSLDALRAECAALSAAMFTVTADDWTRPTGCQPWDVAGLLGHVDVILAWLPGMLGTTGPSPGAGGNRSRARDADAAPPLPEDGGGAPGKSREGVSAVGYYRADERFSVATSAKRIELGQGRAGLAGIDALPAVFERTWREVVRLCEHEPEDRVVVTRHGDSMLLSDFLATRVVEVGVHGLDLAAALDRDAWLTPAASELLVGLFGPDLVAGRDDLTFIRTATGRLPLANGELPGPNWPFLG
ncbi:hypothetical protein GCM10010435_31520 [Winogradskya consettensis]|uniref:Mycothiol-dependent maleylpyruvate isomerase metal-binding domain-containing protein n=3 Tax=Winogradskya consettensis TaxID=113560 RepID=A0A919SEN8_9ACTN|nr:hypothetical protein Aco04nite_19980 [Actinoplanes consettensis]